MEKTIKKVAEIAVHSYNRMANKHTYKRIIFFTALIIGISYVGSFFIAQAHYELVDTNNHNISAELHIAPNDSPVVGMLSQIHFEFTDKQALFNVYKCDCRLSIAHNNKIIVSEKVNSATTTNRMHNDGVTFTYDYVFPTTGIYTISALGRPLRGNSFQPFMFLYDLRVDSSINGTTGDGENMTDYAQHMQAMNAHDYFRHHLTHILFFGSGFIIALVLIFTTPKDSVENIVAANVKDRDKDKDKI